MAIYLAKSIQDTPNQAIRFYSERERERERERKGGGAGGRDRRLVRYIRIWSSKAGGLW